MVRVSFEIRGKRISLEELDTRERRALEKVAGTVARILASVRCEKHGCTPEVLVLGEDAHHLEFRIRGCCVELMNAAMDQLRGEEFKEWWQRDHIPTEPWVED